MLHIFAHRDLSEFWTATGARDLHGEETRSKPWSSTWLNEEKKAGYSMLQLLGKSSWKEYHQTI